MPRLPARGEDVRGIQMERRAEKLGQTGRSEPTLASAHSETCPVYLGHSPSPNWQLDPRCVPPPQQLVGAGVWGGQDDQGLGTSLAALGLSLIPCTPRQQLPHPQAPVEV